MLPAFTKNSFAPARGADGFIAAVARLAHAPRMANRARTGKCEGPATLQPRSWEPTAEHPLPTRRHGQVLPPGASRRGRWGSAATAIPAWIILGVIWWRAIVEQPDQLAFGALIWAACALTTRSAGPF